METQCGQCNSIALNNYVPNKQLVMLSSKDCIFRLQEHHIIYGVHRRFYVSLYSCARYGDDECASRLEPNWATCFC
eukprot:3866232-Pleurochrysis_carterae.AAC.3